MPIRGLYARQIFDSRGNPTVEVDLMTELGIFRSSVPSARYILEDETKEIRDGGSKYQGLGVTEAVDNVNEKIAPELAKTELEVTQQYDLDQLLVNIDGTAKKEKLGGNALLGVSMSIAKAGAAKRGLPLYQHIADLAETKSIILPVPIFSVIDGGEHARNKLIFREIMVMPTGASSFSDAMKLGSELYYNLSEIIKERVGLQGLCIGDMGGFAPNIDANLALKYTSEAIKQTSQNGIIELGIDISAKRFYKNGLYDLDYKNPKSNKKQWIKAKPLLQLYKQYINDYSVVYMQDPFDEEDHSSWYELRTENKIQVVSESLTLSRSKLIQDAAFKGVCNAVTIKINQAGTVTEAIQVHLFAKDRNWSTVVSSRSGDTEDSFIADFAVGISANQIKSGGLCRAECVEKYNQILRIEEEMGSNVRYAGDYLSHMRGIKYADELPY